MDTEMEYVPMNIKQEVESAASSASISETTVNGSSSNNNPSSQAAPDSVENKVSVWEMKDYLKLKFLNL